MKTLIIHPKDKTTEFLSEVYRDMNNYTLIQEGYTLPELKTLIESHDRVIMMGHGTSIGLFDFKTFKYAVDKSFVDVLRTKANSVYIWCNADEFVKEHDLKGFYTGMIISEKEEARAFNVTYTSDNLNESNQKFTLSVKEGIDKSPELMAETIKNMYNNSDNDIMSFNRNNIYYN